MSEKKEKIKKPRASLIAAGKTGVSALAEAVNSAPKAPSAGDRLAKSRAEKETAIRAALTTDVLKLAQALRAKGYGYSIIANTLTDALSVKVGTRIVKSILDTADTAAHTTLPLQQRTQQAATQTVAEKTITAVFNAPPSAEHLEYMRANGFKKRDDKMYAVQTVAAQYSAAITQIKAALGSAANVS